MRVRVQLSSFGLKYRRGPAANLTFDVRGLDNPADIAELRPLTGLDDDVAKHVLDQDLAQETLDVLMAAIVLQLHVTARPPTGEVRVAIFCDDGKHRSVVMVDEVAAQLRVARPDVVIATEHLDIRSGRESPRRSIELGEMW